MFRFSFGFVNIEKVLPPVVFLASGFLFGDFSANHLPPALNFSGAVRTRRAVLNGKELVTQLYHFIVLDGGATAIARLLA
jgi:hypothetical protein